MKNIIIKTGTVLGIAASLLCSSCDDYLSTIPKGEKIPLTFEDYNAFIRYQDLHYNDNSQQLYLMNDIFQTQSFFNSYELARINYMWDEQADRKVQDNQPLYSSNTTTYLQCYQAISHWCLIIEDANKLTECTPQQQEMIKAQAKVLRAMAYFHLVNYYADQYTKENAKMTLAVPLVVSANVQSPSPQVSIDEIYQFIISDLSETSIELLPLSNETLFHPTKAAGYGMLARVYLQMSDYENALKFAQKALDINSKLFDWRPYYLANKTEFDNPDLYAYSFPEVTRTNPENYVFAFSTQMATSKPFNIPLERAADFEPGDLRLITKWKFRKYETGDRFFSFRGDNFNGGGISSPEMYYIKAECLARKGQIKEAMDLLNDVRITRFRTEDYKPLAASTEIEAINYIRKDKSLEFLQTVIPFYDMRRFNKDPKYATTLTKVVNGKTYTLKPDSHMWIMPFSEKIMTNPGNNPIQQNTPR